MLVNLEGGSMSAFPKLLPNVCGCLFAGLFLVQTGLYAQDIRWVKFDDVPSGTLAASYYAGQGVRFVTDDVGTTAYRSRPTVEALAQAWSGPNVLVNRAQSEIFSSAGAPLVLVFQQPIHGIGLRAGTPAGAPAVTGATISLLDCAGDVVASEALPVSANFSSGIQVYHPDQGGLVQTVVIDYGATTVPETIDDLAFEMGGGGCADVLAPVVNILSHTDQQVLANGNIVLIGRVTDNSGLVDRLRVNGVSGGLTPLWNTNGSLEFEFRVPLSLPEGSHPVNVLAWDLAGNIGKENILLHVGAPQSVTMEEIHITQRGVMRDDACDIDEPLVAGKFTIIRLKLDARTASGAKSYVEQAKVYVWRKIGAGLTYLHEAWGTTYSPFVSQFDSPSSMAGIHFWIPGEILAEAGEYRFEFLAYVNDQLLIRDIPIPCGVQLFTFSETAPIRAFMCPTEAPFWAPELGSEWLTQTMATMDFVQRAFPIADGALQFVTGYPLSLSDGSHQARNQLDYVEGTGFEWTFIDKDPAGISRGDTEFVFNTENKPYGGRIKSSKMITLPNSSGYGIFLPGGPAQWDNRRYVEPLDDDHDGGVEDDLGPYLGEFYDEQSSTWMNDLINYNSGEVFRSFVDTNGNHLYDKGEVWAPAVQRWENIRTKLLFGPAKRRMDQYNQNRPVQDRAQHAVLWFPEPVHPWAKDFGMFDPGQGDLNGDAVWVRIPPVYDNPNAIENGEKPNGAASTLAHEMGHNYGLKDTYYKGTPPAKYLIPAKSAYNYYHSVPRPDKLVGIMHGGHFLSRLFFTDEHYQFLFDKLKTASAKNLGESPGLKISGAYSEDEGMISWDMSVQEDAEFGPDDPESPFTVRLLTGQGGESLVFGIPLHGAPMEEPFNNDGPDWSGIDEEPSGGITRFELVVPIPEQFQGIEIRQGDELVHEAMVSARVPEIQLVVPSGREFFRADEDVEIHWTARDRDGDELTFSIEYSWDGGGRWQVLASGIQGEQFLWRTAGSPGGEECLLRVIASDGFHRSTAMMEEVFHVEPKPPIASILAPAAGELFLEGQLVELRGMGLDPEGQLVSAEWIVHGPGGQEWHPGGTQAVLPAFPSGHYEVVFVVLDSEQMMAEAHTFFEVLQDSDQDGLSDEYEEECGLDPSFHMDALLDQDGDGLISFDEARLGSRADVADTDGDGYSDGEEIERGSDPTNSADYPGSLSAPVIAGIESAAPGRLRLIILETGTGLPGTEAEYIIEHADALNGMWMAVEDAVITSLGDGYFEALIDVEPLPAEFFRVRAWAPGF
jgi:hypothetical protein